jgi:hypothetical protein
MATRLLAPLRPNDRSEDPIVGVSHRNAIDHTGEGDEYNKCDLEDRCRAVRAFADGRSDVGSLAARRCNEADAGADRAGNLFEQNQHPQQAALDQTIDTIRAQFGTDSIGRGILLNRRSAENGDEQFE